MDSRGGRLRRAAAGLLVALSLFIGAEITLRLGLGPPPAVQVFSTRGAGGAWFAVEGERARATYQAPAPTPPFPVSPAGERVLCLGGSSVHMGAGRLPLEREFCGLLGRRLGVEALNLGAPGLDSFDLVSLLEAALDFAPTTVVLYTGHNDFGNAWFEERYAGQGGAARAWTEALLGRLWSYTGLVRMLAPAPPPERQGPRNRDKRDSEQAAMTAARVARTLTHLRTNLERLVWLADRADAALVMVVPVSNLCWPPRGGPGTAAAHERYQAGMRSLEAAPQEAAALLREARDLDIQTLRATTAAQAVVRDVAARGGAALVDAERGLPRHASGADFPAPTLFADNLHFSAAGHAAAAALIADALSIRPDPPE